MTTDRRSVFSRRRTFGLFFVCLSIVFAGTVSTLAQKPARSSSTPETALLNSLWDQGLAAGNIGDWYRNCDNWHASIATNSYPQLTIAATGYALQTGIIDAPRTIIGNASLGVNGSWGMIRFIGMLSSSSANSLYNQYRASQHYAYPAVNDVRDGQRDMMFAMFPYATQSFGKSHSEEDELRKFIHTLAAFKPEVKALLIEKGLLIPTLQMVWRRTRVADDAAYLSGAAHPSAFDNNANDLAMIEMANAINTDDIPPMIQLSVVSENFGDTHATRYNEYNRSERRFTTPAAIARIHYGIEYTKRIVVDASNSFDTNGRPLTWHFAVLRGAPGSVRINPRNPEGSLVEIEFDHQEDRLVDGTDGQTSSLAIVGAFVHNGTYYSAPGFITSYSLWNETRFYDGHRRLREIAYLGNAINNETGNTYALSLTKDWTKDIYSYDFNGRPAGWIRTTDTLHTSYSAEGLLVIEQDQNGRPASVAEVQYISTNNKSVVAFKYAEANWQSRMAYKHVRQTTPVDQMLTHDFNQLNVSISAMAEPAHGTLTVRGGRNGGPYYDYTPQAGFRGIDAFSVMTLNPSASTGTVYRVRVAVGPEDTSPPTAVTAPKVTGMTASRAVVSWTPSSDNVEVLSYRVFRDGALLGETFLNTFFEDDSVVPGESYIYTVTALDDAGNESPLSGTAVGGAADLWGQDNFADGNYSAIDPNLVNGLSWNVPAGVCTVATVSGTRYLRPGVSHPVESMVVTDRSIAAPFVLEFFNHQQYVTNNQGPMLLWQNPDNFYLFAINSNRGELKSGLYRVRNGEYTLLAEASELGMQHRTSSADFRIAVTHTGDAISFQVTKSNWSSAPGAVKTGEFFDTDPAAAAFFREGAIGFIQGTTANPNPSYYTNVKISKLAGNGPDLDDDGLLDAWERLHFGTIDHPDAQPQLDPDGDGFDNLTEMQEGTNPTSATSNPLRFVETGTSGNTLKLSWRSFTDQTYSVFYATSLAPANWAALPGYAGLPATPPYNELQIDASDLPPEQAFFRIRSDMQ